MSKTLLIALASVFAAGSAAAAGLGHGPMMARDGIAARHDASTMVRKSNGADDGIDHRQGKRADDLVFKSKGADDVRIDNRLRNGKDDLIFKRKGADNPPGDVRQGRGADDPAGDDHRGRRDDPPGHG